MRIKRGDVDLRSYDHRERDDDGRKSGSKRGCTPGLHWRPTKRFERACLLLDACGSEREGHPDSAAKWSERKRAARSRAHGQLAFVTRSRDEPDDGEAEYRPTERTQHRADVPRGHEVGLDVPDWIPRPEAMSAVRSMVASSLGLFVLAACSGKDPFSPGQKLGTFHVSAKLTHSSCGPTPDPWEFDVRLHHDASTLYWIQGGVPIEGRVDTTARARLEAEIVHEVRAADARSKRQACAISRTDVLALTLADADAEPTNDPALARSFAGELVYAFTPTAGSDCSDQVAASGGDFDALPCEVHYNLHGAFVSSTTP